MEAMKVLRKTAAGALLIVLFAVCASLAVVAWSALDVGGGARSAGPVPGLPDDGRPSASTGDTDGDVRLPPTGASPSAPEQGEFLMSLDARPGTGFPGSFVPVHQVWVYSDGRVIRRREGGPYGANGVNTGLLEQRLTPEGVELVRSEVLSTGLFDRDGYFQSEQGLSWGMIEARNGDRLVTAVWCCPDLIPRMELHGGAPDLNPTPRQARALIRLSEGLADLTSWLPESAWEGKEPKAFVPSGYAICYRGTIAGGIGHASLEPSRVFSELPAPARDLLRGKDKEYDVLSGPLLAKSESTEHAPCSEVTIEDARALEEILGDAGFELSSDPGREVPDAGRFDRRAHRLVRVDPPARPVGTDGQVNDKVLHI